MKDYQLLDGYSIPAVGLGTYKLRGAQGRRQITQAIDLGYRLIDTAYNYENEGTVGQAIRDSHVHRDHLVVASKLAGRYHRYDDAMEQIQESLDRLGLDYLDLFLIHWPNPKEDHYVEAWQALIDAQKAGLIRSIGTSNFLPEHIDRLEAETGVLPVVNQVELTPYYNQHQERAYHEEKGIITQAWSPIARAGQLLQESIIQDLAQKYQRTPGQIVLRWHTQLGVVPIPKSGNWQRQQDNLNLFDFELSPEDMELINQLDSPEGRRADRHPSQHQEF